MKRLEATTLMTLRAVKKSAPVLLVLAATEAEDADVAAALDLELATARRYLTSLVDLGLVYSEQGLYSLTPDAAALLAAAPRPHGSDGPADPLESGARKPAAVPQQDAPDQPSSPGQAGPGHPGGRKRSKRGVTAAAPSAPERAAPPQRASASAGQDDPPAELQPPYLEITPPKRAGKKTAVNTTTTTTTTALNSNQKAVAVGKSEPQKPKKRPESQPSEDPGQVSENLAAFREEGVGANRRVLDVCRMKHVTADYIQAQAERLRREERFSGKLLLFVVQSGDPLPKDETPPEDDPHRYITGKYAHLIEH